MWKSVNAGKSARGLLLALMWSGAPAVLAHTDVMEPALEGKGALNALLIEHGCLNPVTGKSRPVIAQSVVFPTQNPRLTRSDGTPSPGLQAEIRNAAGLAGRVSLIQDRNIFRKQRKTLDANENVIGFSATHGGLKPELLGRVPFYLAPVSFPASSCARTLHVQIAVADICSRTFPPKVGTANLWIPEATPRFGDASVEGIGTPARLTIQRDLAENPLPVHCGEGYAVTVTPSPEDIDAHLPIPGYWAKP